MSGEDYGADGELAGRFLASVAERLKIPTRFVFPAYEDNFYYLWREGTLRRNVSKRFTSGRAAGACAIAQSLQSGPG